MTIERLAEGRIAEIWVARDEVGLMRQLGAIPVHEPAGAA
jgi:predicted ester cyclase